MAMSAEKVASLRRKLMAEKDLAKVWKYFLDTFADSPGFMKAGAACECKELDERMELVGRHVYGKAGARVSDQAWAEVRECEGVAVELIHGACRVEGKLATAIWFPELSLGVAGFPGGGGKMQYARFKPADIASMPAKPGVQ
jgi:hypothetical protein